MLTLRPYLYTSTALRQSS